MLRKTVVKREFPIHLNRCITIEKHQSINLQVEAFFADFYKPPFKIINY